jgi:hypothetical protein
VRRGESVPVALAAIVVIAASVHAVLGLMLPAPFVVPDELIYSELAKSLGSGNLPSLRGETYFDLGVTYPLLIAPMWAVFEDVTTAYAAAKVLNAVMMSLTAIPAFFLARRFTTADSALVVAALSVTVPSLLYSGMLMTEVALYPAFVLAVLAIAVATDRPTTATQFGALAAIGLVFSIKSIGVVLLAAYPAVILLRSWLERRDSTTSTRSLRVRFRVTWVALGLIAVSVVAGAMVSGRAPQAALGTYSSVIEHPDPGAIPSWVLAHAGELVLAVAVIPFAAALAVTFRGLRRNADALDRRCATLVVPLVALWLVAVGTSASVPFLEEFEYPANGGRMQGRATFMLAPLLFLGLMIWMPRRAIGRTSLVIVAATTVALPAFIPLHSGLHSYFQALPLALWESYGDSVRWPLGGVVATAVLTSVWVLAARRDLRASVVLATIGVALFAMLGIASGAMQARAEWSRYASSGVSPRWVDEAVPNGQSVSVLWAEAGTSRFLPQRTRHRIVFIGEFFNRSIGNVYEIGPSLPYALPATPVRVVGRRVVDLSGRPADLGPYVLSPCYVTIDGDVIARDEGTGAAVYRVRPPVRVAVGEPDSCSGDSGLD